LGLRLTRGIKALQSNPPRASANCHPIGRLSSNILERAAKPVLHTMITEKDHPMLNRRALFTTIGAICGAVPVLALSACKARSATQQALLDDALVIYRIGRSPERFVYQIDVGALPPDRARAHIAQIKTDILQRRIPTA
jgi:hypothetical protein